MTNGRGMLRRGAAVATALGTAAAVLLAPGPASAVTNRLTVVTLTRSGAPLAVRVTAYNLANGSTYSLTSGTAKTLPAGRYAVLTDIYNPADPVDTTDTLGARIVTVSGSTKTTIDARAGKPVGIGLTPDPGVDDRRIDAVICAQNSFASAVGAYNSPGKMFVIPNASTSLRFATQSTWLVPDGSGPGTGYAVVRSRTGLPAGYTPTVATSTLAGVRFDVRHGPAGSPTTSTAVQPGGSGCESMIFGGFANADAPYRMQTYLSPGPWLLRADTSSTPGEIGFQWKELTVTAGGRYSQSFFNSAWGPARALPLVLRSYLNFDASSMFTDPLFARGIGSEGTTKATMTLSRSGTVLKRQTGADVTSPDALAFRYHLSTAGWYQLAVDARRYRPDAVLPSDLLSTRSTASFRFYADPAKDRVARVYLVRFTPRALGMTNTAAPGSVTTVSLNLDRPRQDPDAALTTVTLKSLTVQASYDNGSTWHTVKATQTSGRWSAAVPNPAAGTVSLRATAVATTGDRSVITVYKAYAVG